MDNDTIDRCVVLLTGGRRPGQVVEYLERQGVESESAGEAVQAARDRIVKSAEFDRDEKLGTAIRRLEDLYSKSIVGPNKDVRTALQAQKELNRLLSLGGPGGDGGDGGDAVGRLDLIASYLLPLELTDARYPIEEHARVAAEEIHKHRDEA